MMRAEGEARLPAVAMAAGVFLALLAILLVVWTKGLLRSARRTDCAAHANAISSRFEYELDQRLAAIKRGRDRPPEAKHIYYFNSEGYVDTDPNGGADPSPQLVELAMSFPQGDVAQPIPDPRGELGSPAHWVPYPEGLPPFVRVGGPQDTHPPRGRVVVWDVAKVKASIVDPMIAERPDEYEVVLLPPQETPDDLAVQVRSVVRPPPPFAFWRLGVGLRDTSKTRQLDRVQSWLLGLLAVWLLVILVGSLWLYTRRERQAKLRTRAREQFLTRAYHELQTPLALMRAAAETVGRGAAERPQDVARCVDIILREEERLTRTVRRLLRYLRVESAAEALGEAAPLRAEVERSVEDHRAALEAQGLQLEVDVGDFPVERTAPRDLVGDTLAELLGNARKYAAEGTRVRVGLSLHGERARLVVEDDGPGLGSVDPEALFAPWKQQASAEKPTGSGLGLALLREGLALAGGSIRCEPGEGGKGARFVVEL